LSPEKANKIFLFIMGVILGIAIVMCVYLALYGHINITTEALS
jgi:uncharacterized membrane protein (Fun14 family)